MRLKINGAWWKIKHKTKIMYLRKEVDGLCDYDRRTIYIKRGLEREYSKLVMLHEFMHAALFELGINLGYELDEKLVDGVSSLIHDHFIMRPKW